MKKSYRNLFFGRNRFSSGYGHDIDLNWVSIPTEASGTYYCHDSNERWSAPYQLNVIREFIYKLFPCIIWIYAHHDKFH